MLQRKFYGPRATYIPPPVTGNGYFAAGPSNTSVTIYNLSSDVVGVALGVFPASGPATSNAAGNSTAGIFERANSTRTTYRYQYVGDVVTTAGNLTTVTGSGYGCGCGNDVKGIFGMGTGTDDTNAT